MALLDSRTPLEPTIWKHFSRNKPESSVFDDPHQSIPVHVRPPTEVAVLSPADTAISFIIPARNEELLLAKSLEQIRHSATAVGRPFEVIVVDDASTDRTAEIVVQHGARLVSVELHNIAAVRNAGAAVAKGDVLIFLDADTLLPERTLRAILQALARGAVGGGASVRFDGKLNWLQRYLAVLFGIFWQRLGGWAAGCCVYARRDAFEQVGGFNPKFFAAEEREITRALKRLGKFVIVWEPVYTSSRKIRLFSTWSITKLAVDALILRPDRLKRREGLEYLYAAPREEA